MMNLSLYKEEIFDIYKSNSQIARVLSESWFSSEMYCPCCLNLKINRFPNNEKIRDFFCIQCKNEFQLKSSNKRIGNRVLDGEFKTMCYFIKLNKTPNFFLMQYSNTDWFVKNLFIIPKFFISHSVIEKRKPLSKFARRHGWIGCNIILNNLPEDGKIQIIRNEEILDKTIVNNRWKKMFFLNNKKADIKGWTSDVLKCVEDLSKWEFTLNDLYQFKGYLKELHPNNKNIEAKIRQQLQILRDNKLIVFKSRGVYQYESRKG